MINLKTLFGLLLSLAKAIVTKDAAGIASNSLSIAQAVIGALTPAQAAALIDTHPKAITLITSVQRSAK